MNLAIHPLKTALLAGAALFTHEIRAESPFPCRFDELTSAEVSAGVPASSPSSSLDFMRGVTWKKACDSRQLELFKVVGPYLLQQTIRYFDSDCENPLDPRALREYYVYTWEDLTETAEFPDYTKVKLKLHGFCSVYQDRQGREFPSFLSSNLVIRDFPKYQAFKAFGAETLDHASGIQLPWLGNKDQLHAAPAGSSLPDQ